jgi:regulator of nonsense transcripts 2
MPPLEDSAPESAATDGMIRGVGTGVLGRVTEEFVPGGVWEDEDARKFYEDIVDLKERVPPGLLDESVRAPAERTTSPEFVRENVDEESDSGEEVPEDKPSTLDNTTIANKGVGQKVDLLLMRMPESSNRDLIDQIAVEFMFLNSKASRNRLLKKLLDVPRNRQDVLPYYSRFIATLTRYIPDIGKIVVEEVPPRPTFLTKVE